MERISEKGMFWTWNEGVKGWWMMKVVKMRLVSCSEHKEVMKQEQTDDQGPLCCM